MVINISDKHAIGNYEDSCLAKNLPKAILAKLPATGTHCILGFEDKLLYLYPDLKKNSLVPSGILNNCISFYTQCLKGTTITFTQTELY